MLTASWKHMFKIMMATIHTVDGITILSNQPKTELRKYQYKYSTNTNSKPIFGNLEMSHTNGSMKKKQKLKTRSELQ